MLFFWKCETEEVPSSYNNPIKNAFQQGLLHIEYVFTLCHSTIYHKLPHLYYKYSHLSSLRNSSFFTVVLESIGCVYFQGSSSKKLTSLGLRQLLKGKWWVVRCRSCSQTAAFRQSNPARHTGRFSSVGIYKFQSCNVHPAWRRRWSCFCDIRQTSVPNSTRSSTSSDAGCLRGENTCSFWRWTAGGHRRHYDCSRSLS